MSHIDLSITEYHTLCRNATRGAGYPWSIADEAAHAVCWLEQHGISSTQVLLEWLTHVPDWPANVPEHPEQTHWQARSGRLCPLATGLGFSDQIASRHPGDQLAWDQVSEPLLLLPFLAEAADEAMLGLSVNCDKHQLSITPSKHEFYTGAESSSDHLPIHGRHDVQIRMNEVACLTRQPPARAAHPRTRARSSEAEHQRLLDLAARTYAPATEASRRLGAGASLTDND